MHEPPMSSKPGQHKDFRVPVVDEALQGIIVTDEVGTVLSFNKAAAALFGYSSDEVIGRNVRMLLADPYRNQHETYLRVGPGRLGWITELS